MKQLPLSARIRPVVVFAVRFLVAGIFAYAAWPKFLDPVAFAADIANYRVPYWMWNPAAAVVPVLELLGALMLLHPRHARVGALALSGLTIVFLVLIYSVIARGIDIDCGCFGQAQQASRVGWELFLRDLVLLFLTVIAAMSPRASERQ